MGVNKSKGIKTHTPPHTPITTQGLGDMHAGPPPRPCPGRSCVNRTTSASPAGTLIPARPGKTHLTVSCHGGERRGNRRKQGGEKKKEKGGRTERYNFVVCAQGKITRLRSADNPLPSVSHSTSAALSLSQNPSLQPSASYRFPILQPFSPAGRAAPAPASRGPCAPRKKCATPRRLLPAPQFGCRASKGDNLIASRV